MAKLDLREAPRPRTLVVECNTCTAETIVAGDIETKATFSLEHFMARVKDDSFARINRYEVLIPDCPGTTEADTVKLVNMYCEQSQLPMLNVNTKPLRIYGPAHQRAAGIDFGGEGLVMQFYVDRDMKVKRVFDSWMGHIINLTSYHAAYPSAYMRDIVINQLDEHNNITYSIKLIDAFPRTQQLLQLDYSGDGIHRLQVSFVYRKWEYTKFGAPAITKAKDTHTPTQQRNKTLSPLFFDINKPKARGRDDCPSCHSEDGSTK